MSYFPSLDECKRQNQQYNLLPLYKEVVMDTETPITLYQRLMREEGACFLLESAEGGEKWGRYSFIGLSPFLHVEGTKEALTIRYTDGREECLTGNPLQNLQVLLNQYKSPPQCEGPRFTGGAVGYLGYDVLGFRETLPAHAADDLRMNDFQLLFTDRLLVIDHYRQRVRVYVNLHVPIDCGHKRMEEAYETGCREIEALLDRLNQPILGAPIPRLGTTMPEVKLNSNLTKEEFCQNVLKAKDYIAQGDIFQVVLSQRFEKETVVDPFLVYRVLRVTNPSPYMYHLRLPDLEIVGTSPELLIRVESGLVETVPIAGTRPRGKSKEEDEALAEELFADPKERAEHTMLVDLGRNDIGRVSRYGSVVTDQFMQVEKYSQVMHLVSHVQGELRDDMTPLDALLSCMPAGTVSGAPKLRAMEIIAELEREKRGVYAGAIGYLGFDGNLDTCIAIRTILFRRGKAYLQAGAGIVSDSDPQSEYRETLSKTKACALAIEMAERDAGLL